MINRRTARPLNTVAAVAVFSTLIYSGCAATRQPPPVVSAPAGVSQSNALATGHLSYSGQPVPQNGEVVFNGLPAGNIRLTYDTSAWSHHFLPDSNGKQRLVLVSRKPGTQKKCEIDWELLR